MTTLFTRPLHLTKLIVNPAHPQANQALRDIYRMHQILTTFACPPNFGPASRTAAELLYRIDHTTTGIHILLQSATQPDPAHVPPGFAHAGTRDLTPLLDHLHTHPTIRYRITLNATTSRLQPRPTTSDDQPKRPRGTLITLTGEDALTWWHTKAPHHGLQPHTTATADTTKSRGRKNKKPITITATTIEGTATITNPHTLQDSLRTGIGRARAFGCGLLTIAPLNPPTRP
ncbi:type I-E CRISPR-associated protein Cas6/Cse3/CasE [Actinokineospora sp. 24-640]